MIRLSKVLVANRGEIARRILRTARDMGLGTVAVFSDADADSPHVGEADIAIRLPGSRSADTYLRGDLLIEAARRGDADAVHPGYGFLSENAEFARSCIEAGLTWVGPPPDAIAALGSKVEAKRLMEAAGVPVLPWCTVDPAAPSGELRAAAEAVGYPVLVKASMGGGGRGMRVVRHPDDLDEAVRSAQGEAAAAFGDGTVFLEHYLDAPRHIEVQVLYDNYGTGTHLFERECSVQRRYQKIIEETPSPAVGSRLRAAMCAAALAGCKAVGYVGAGTVEFVVDGDWFFFLEVNTRLQVEHPVTELVTGLDLVRLQLCIARGDPLPAEALKPNMRGHAIEARLYAEDPANAHLPTSGRLHRIHFPARPGLRVDAGYVDGSVIGIDYDAMLAKVVAWAPTRSEAASLLASSLAAASIHGPATNRDLLVAALRTSDFLAGRTDTALLERNAEQLTRPVLPEHTMRLHALAAVIAERIAASATAPTPPSIPLGWRNVGPSSQTTSFDVDGTVVTIGTDLTGVEIRRADASVVEVEDHGIRYRITVHQVDGTHYVDSPLGSTVLHRRPRFPDPGRTVQVGSLVSPLPGAVVDVLVRVGDAVAEGQPLLVVEAMKMQHTIRAPRDGTVSGLNAGLGDQVGTGDVLLVLEASGDGDDP
ncbi:MAG: acetyl/propionyl/methylcrotonyl-CoA carboxylase subunit alpha [Acidimicrobiales bacterium]